MERINFRDSVDLFWRARYWMGGATVFCLLVGMYMFLNAAPQYEATMILVPTEANQYALQSGGTASSLASSITGQLLGVPGDKSAQLTAQFVELLTSPLIVERTDKRYHIIQTIYSGLWNAQERRWSRPSGILTSIKEALNGVLHRPEWSPPGPYEAAAYLKAAINVDSPRGSSLIHISVRNADPAFAALLLNALYQETDGLLRERARAQTNEHIDYIQRQLAVVSYAENRQSLTALLTAELGKQILINSNAPFVAERLEPVVVSPAPVSPKSNIYILGSVAIGLMLGLALYLLRGKINIAKMRIGVRGVMARPRVH